MFTFYVIKKNKNKVRRKCVTTRVYRTGSVCASVLC